MAKRRRLTLVSGSSSKPSEPRAIGVQTDRPIVRAGGLFSEAVMPMVEEDAIVDPDIFFTLPDTISLLQEQIAIGNLPSLAEKNGPRSV